MRSPSSSRSWRRLSSPWPWPRRSSSSRAGTVGRSRSRLRVLLLAAATTMRTAALFAVPVWLLYVLWAHRRPRLIGPAALGLMLPLLAYASWHAADTGPVRAHAGGRLVPVRPRGRDRRLWQRGHPVRCPAALQPQRARPPGGCGVPHLERRRPGAAHLRRDELGPRPAGRSNDALRGFARAIIRDRPGALRAAGPGRLPALLHSRRPRARELRPRGRVAAVRPARAPQRDRAGSVVPRLRAAREPAGQAGARLPRADPRPAAVDGGARDRRAAPARGRGSRLRSAPATAAAPPRGVPAGRRRARDAARHRRHVRVRAALPDPGRCRCSCAEASRPPPTWRLSRLASCPCRCAAGPAGGRSRLSRSA